MNSPESVLLAKIQELTPRLQNRDFLHIEKSADPLDNSIGMSDRDTAVDLLRKTDDTLSKVKAALDRVRDGSYGVCLTCEEPISPKRLNAVPWATYCIKCQELADQAGKN